MNYDKNSFLAGIAVGRRLKGWASGGDLNMGGGSGNIIIVGTFTPIKKSFHGVIVDLPEIIVGTFESEGN